MEASPGGAVYISGDSPGAKALPKRSDAFPIRVVLLITRASPAPEVELSYLTFTSEDATLIPLHYEGGSTSPMVAGRLERRSNPPE